MPVYDYVCGTCRHRFEVFRGLNEAGPHQCPLCEGPVTRAFAPPTILFKGSGWAKVDRRATSAPTKRSKGSESAGDDRAAATAVPGGGSEGSSDGRSSSSDARGGSSDEKGSASQAAPTAPAASPAD